MTNTSGSIEIDGRVYPNANLAKIERRGHLMTPDPREPNAPDRRAAKEYNTPAGQDHPTPEEKGQSATVDALANAAGRGTPEQPSAEAMEAAKVLLCSAEFMQHFQHWPVGARHYSAEAVVASAVDAFAARRMVRAVIQERERAARIVRGRPIYEGHYREWPEWGPGHRSADDVTVALCESLAEAIESGRPKP